MYKNYKIISVTPAGRKRYLKILDFYLRKNKNIIDKHIFWVNTKNQEDIDYMKYLVKKYPEFYELEYLNQDSKEIYNNYSVKNIHNFFKNCIDENTIYIRFDDDICFIDQNAIQNLIDCRIDNPEFFIVYPLIINNCFMIDLLQQKNLSSNEYGVAGESRVGKGWQDPLIGKNIHEEFLQNIIDNKIEIYNFGNYIIENFTPVSINSFCWFGKEFKKFQGNVHEDEELWLSHIKPSLIDKKNLICTSAVVSHFSFQSQNNYFETETNLYDNYYNLSKGQEISLVYKNQKLDNLFKLDYLLDRFLTIEKYLEIQRLEVSKFNQKNQYQKEILQDCTVVIPIGNEFTSLENLLYIIQNINDFFEVKIIIIDISEKNKIEKNFFKKFTNVDYIYEKNDFKYRNKYLNKLYDQIETKIIIFCEAFCLIYPDALKQCVEEIRQSNYNFAIPSNGLTLDYNKKSSEKIIQSKIIPCLDRHFCELEEQIKQKIFLNFPLLIQKNYGYSWIFSKEVYNSIGYDNPFLLSSNNQNYEKILRAKKMGHNIYQPKIGSCYLLWQNDDDLINLSTNLNELKKIDNFSVSELKMYINYYKILHRII